MESVSRDLESESFGGLEFPNQQSDPCQEMEQDRCAEVSSEERDKEVVVHYQQAQQGLQLQQLPRSGALGT